MMGRFLSMSRETSPLAYALITPLLFLSQHALVASISGLLGLSLTYDFQFWILPLNELLGPWDLTPLQAVLTFTFGLVVAWLMAVFSFRRALYARRGYTLAAFSIVPAFQVVAVAALALMPRRHSETEGAAGEHLREAHRIQGALAGIALIVFAMLVSAVTIGAYGWGIFVLTPFTVGVTAAYIANRDTDIGLSSTFGLVMWSSALGSLALIMFALEGLACIVMAAPLAALMALIGAAIGYSLAGVGHRRGRPLFTIALLPAAFMLEGATPPSLDITATESIEIAASPEAVWEVLTSDDPISAPPGLVGKAGLAYALRGHLVDQGVGAERIGYFSTGIARERITQWSPNRRLAFVVIDQPPAMEEMSPYRQVHAPHVQGYFDTGETRFDLEPISGGRTRLTVAASHVLRIDPIPYWEPFARWALRANMRRVLGDTKSKAEFLSAH